MRLLLALPLALTFACAGMSSSTAGTTGSSQACAEGVSATAYRGAEVFPGPDSTLRPVATLKEDTPVCASASSQGFGFRRVKLANGTSGYVAESSLSI